VPPSGKDEARDRAFFRGGTSRAEGKAANVDFHAKCGRINGQFPSKVLEVINRSPATDLGQALGGCVSTRSIKLFSI
jgi:hypothetical protein